jgi:hypothetical protein
MTTLTLNGVAFARPSAPGYKPGQRIIVDATLTLSQAFKDAVDAQGGGSYSASVALTSVTYKRDTGQVLQTINTGLGSVTVTAGQLQRGASSGERLVSALIEDFSVGDTWYTGTSYCTAWAQVGTLILAEDVEADPPTFTPGGLLVRYYNNLDRVGQPVYEGIEVPNIYWDRFTSPQPGVALNFSSRWTGSIKIPETGQYQFRLGHDDGAQLYINGRIAIDNMNNAAAWDYTGVFNFVEDQFVPVWIEHFDGQADAGVFFHWRTPSNPNFVAVPGSVLYPTNGAEYQPTEIRPGIQGRFSAAPVNRY